MCLWNKPTALYYIFHTVGKKLQQILESRLLIWLIFIYVHKQTVFVFAVGRSSGQSLVKTIKTISSADGVITV